MKYLLLSLLLIFSAFADTPPPQKVGVYGTYNSTPPTLSTGANNIIQLDVNANLKVNDTAANTTLNSVLSNQTNGTQKTKILDGAGNLLTSLSDGNGGNALEVALAATGYVLSSGNSTTAQLATNATFTGTIETVFNQQAASILLTTDQVGTLTINQYIDLAGTRRTNSWTYTIAGGVPFSRSFTVNGNYFNLTFKNTGASTTTTLNINTAYGTLPATTNSGNTPVSFDEVSGSAMTLGQKTMAASLPVVLPSDQTISTKTDLTSNSPIAVSIGTSSTVVIAANSNRKGLILTNNSSAKIYLGLSNTAVLGSGVLLLPGGSFTMDEFCFDSGAVSAIASVAASSLTVQEFQ